jgi:hypothetical protein
VLASIEKFLEKRLKLKINKAKSAVAKPSVRKFLGFSFTGPRHLLLCDIGPSGSGRTISIIRMLSRSLSLVWYQSASSKRSNGPIAYVPFRITTYFLCCSIRYHLYFSEQIGPMPRSMESAFMSIRPQIAPEL